MPGTVMTISSVVAVHDGGNKSWIDDSNAENSDDTYARTGTVADGETTRMLAFNFSNWADIPLDATFLGWTAAMEEMLRDAVTTDEYDHTHLSFEDGTAGGAVPANWVGPNIADGTLLTGVEVINTYGNSANAGGSVMSDIHGMRVGLKGLRTGNVDSATQFRIDHGVFTIYWEPAGGRYPQQVGMRAGLKL